MAGALGKPLKRWPEALQARCCGQTLGGYCPAGLCVARKDRLDE